MKMVLLSDTHEKTIDNLPQGDLLVHAGDWSGAGTEKETLNFMKWMAAAKESFPYIIVVPGNHERYVYQNQSNVVKMFYQSGIRMLIDEAVEIEGLSIYGTPWTPTFGNWAFMTDESRLQLYFDNIPGGLDLLISHGPPAGILDRNEYGEPCGSIALRDRIKAVNPRNVVFGHIHEARGTETKGITTYHNVSILNEDYRRAGREPVVVEIN